MIVTLKFIKYSIESKRVKSKLFGTFKINLRKNPKRIWFKIGKRAEPMKTIIEKSLKVNENLFDWLELGLITWPQEGQDEIWSTSNEPQCEQ